MVYNLFPILYYLHSLIPLNSIVDQKLEDLDEYCLYGLIQYRNLTCKHISELEGWLILGDWLLKIMTLIHNSAETFLFN